MNFHSVVKQRQSNLDREIRIKRYHFDFGKLRCKLKSAIMLTSSPMYLYVYLPAAFFVNLTIEIAIVLRSIISKKFENLIP